MVGVQDEDAVERARKDRVDLVIFARHREAHAQEVRRVVERVLRIHEGLADRVFVGHRRQRRDLRDHAHRGDHALVRIGDVGRVVIEGRHRADRGDHHRHRMRVAAEALEEAGHLLVHHRVARHAIVEIGLLRGGRQFAVQQQVAGLEEVAVLGQLLDRIAAIEQHALVAVDVGDLRFAARRRREAGIEGEHAGLAVERADVDHGRPDAAGFHLRFEIRVADFDRARRCAHGSPLTHLCRCFARPEKPAVSGLSAPRVIGDCASHYR